MERKRIPPLQVFTYLTIAGISSAFLFLTVSYGLTVYESGLVPFSLPALFHANSFIILASGYAIYQASQSFLRSDWKSFRMALAVTVVLGSAFTVFQIFGWKEWWTRKIYLQSDVGAAYLYVISGLHLFHLLVGMVFLIWEYWRTFPGDLGEVKWLLYETSPDSALRVKMCVIYWHFVDGLWLYLYLFFLFIHYFLGSV